MKPEPLDNLTRAWMRNASDDRAVDNGCRFNVAKAAYAVWWIERNCYLYEGAGAGERLVLHGCHECGQYGIELPDEFDAEGKKACLKRATKYAKCVAAGHRVDWQYECTMRMFGWVRWSDKWKRMIRRFRESTIFIAKKNKKSPTQSAWAMYMLIGDEEPGQKCFLAAKDGKQARENTGRHAIEMLRQNEWLMETCSINKVESKITHEPSRSILLPLSSSNERTEKSKEGLNGSVFVDETHVVDREFMARISRMGISRPEPVFAEFSTAGDDPDSYGKERFDLALRVINGDEEQQGLFAAVYAAPQDVSDIDLEADPMKFGLMANPAMGHTIDPEEYLSDYTKSRVSPSKLAEFKMYRLNVWQNAAAPWLSAEGWAKGRREFSVADYYGRQCWSGLDLSTVQDFSALTLCFPEGDNCYAFLWWFWLPEDTARQIRHLVPIDNWLSDKRVNLLLTPGNRIDNGYIEGTFRDLTEQFDIQEIAYDNWNAEKTTQEIEQGVRDNKGQLVIEGTGIPRLDFSQKLAAFNEPTKRFEASVLGGEILHNGDPLAAWMAQNATIKPDGNNNYKPMKPERGSVKKIDGIITAIMAYWRAVQGDQSTTVYERENRGFIQIG